MGNSQYVLAISRGYWAAQLQTQADGNLKVPAWALYPPDGSLLAMGTDKEFWDKEILNMTTRCIYIQ